MKGTKQDFYHRLEAIKNLAFKSKIKIDMIEGMLAELKSLPVEKGKQGVQTCESEIPSELYVSESQIDQIEDKIMKKRSIKFSLNEELEVLEDELYEIEKIIQTKRECDDNMRRQIDKKMLIISWNTQKQSKPKVEKQSKNKTFGNFTMRLRNIFS